MIAYIKTQSEFDTIIAKAKGENKVVLVDYTATWCGPCKMIAPILDKIAVAADPSKIEFYKVDVDDAHEVAHKAGVSAMPTFRAYNSKVPNGEKDYVEMRGAVPAKLEKLIHEAINGADAA